MSDDLVLVEVDGPVATVTLNRPDARNALSRALRKAIFTTLRDLDARDDLAAIVLTGADPAFCAGVDLKELASGRAARRRRRRGGRAARARSRTCRHRSSAPSTASPSPAASSWRSACDFLVASERARFADTHARVGIMPGWGLTVLLPEAVGFRRAKELSTTGNFLDAATALSWGLVNHVVPHDELLPFCRQLGHDIASVDRRAVRRMLQTYDEGARLDGAGAWALEAEVSNAWQGAGLDPEAIERNRQAVVARGRTQL